jgi:putative hydrolase of the HAD superfamily
MASFKAVTFDFWNTLYVEDEALQGRRQQLRVDRVRELATAFGRECRQQQAGDALEAVWQEHERLWLGEQRTMSLEQVGRTLARSLGGRWRLAHCLQLAEAVSDAVIDAPPRLDPQAAGLLERLGERYRLGIISDTGLGMGRSIRLVMETDGVLRFFQAQSFSNETGEAKPRAGAFADACGRLGVQPRHALHVGDLERSDIVGAKAFGMYAVRIDRNGSGQAKDSAADARIRELAELPDVISELERQLP